MRTFPAMTSADGRLIAFEIENAYAGPFVVARLLSRAEGVTDVARRRAFSSDSEVHVRFKYFGHPCVVWEPYGDNSRYWIGPEDTENFPGDLTELASVFENYRPPAHRAIVGDLLSLRVPKSSK